MIDGIISDKQNSHTVRVYIQLPKEKKKEKVFWYQVAVNITVFVSCSILMLVTVCLFCAAPTASPSNVFAVNRSSSSIEVSWIPPPPETQNGGLSGYKVCTYSIHERAGMGEGGRGHVLL